MPFDADLSPAEIDPDYTARATVSAAEFERIIGEYRARSDAAAAALMAHEGVVYDPCGERLDVLGTGGTPRPAVVFIHGGYWRALSRADARFPATMLARHGIATVAPDYTLAPAVTLTEIVRQMRAAVAHVWHNAAALGIDRERIVVSGSSAGGHLAGALAVKGWQDAFGLPDDAVAAAAPVSGLFDLAPIRRSHVQAWMSLTAEEEDTLSPLRHVPAQGCLMLVALAEGESAGFVRQSAAFAAAWEAAGPTRHLTVPGRNHFDVILDLCDEETALSEALLALVRG